MEEASVAGSASGFVPLRIWLLSLALGMIVGGLFAVVDLPVPAPPSFAGVLAIAGLYFGFELVEVVL